MASTLTRNSNNGIEEELDFRKEVIYFIIVDRFLDGCTDHTKGAMTTYLTVAAATGASIGEETSKASSKRQII